MKQLAGITIALASVYAVPALAQQDASRFYPPAGCTEILTIQSRGCEVTHLYTCEADADGEQWGITFDVDGPSNLGKIDYETQWVESYEMFPMRRFVLVEPPADPANMTELLETGVDSLDFQQRGPDGLNRYVGFDRVLPGEVVIDGETLLKTQFSMRSELANGTVFELEGNEYIIPRLRRFISGNYTRTDTDEPISWDNSPIDFVYPGEPGFFTKTPLYECEPTLARFASPKKGTDQ